MAARSLAPIGRGIPIPGGPDWPGPIGQVRDQIERGISPIKALYGQHGWIDHSSSERLSLHEEHKDWYAEVKTRVLSRRWTPDKLRIITVDPRTAGRENAWLRKARLPKRTDQWRTGEFIRVLEPIDDHPAGTEFRIAESRLIDHSDHAGRVQWLTPGGTQRDLLLAITSCPVQAVKLQPTDGSDPVVTLMELPGTDHWKQHCDRLRQQLRSTSHDSDATEAGKLQLALLQQQVVRGRSAAAITLEQVNGRQFDAVACPEVPWIPEQALELLATAKTELIAVLPDPRGWM